MGKSIYLLIAIGIMLVFLSAFYAYRRLANGWTLKALFKDFNRKIAITLSLGFLFFSLYFVVVTVLASYFQAWGTDLFFLAYKSPLTFIYGGLWLFAILSLCIYLARMVIKYFYLKHGKDN